MSTFLLLTITGLGLGAMYFLIASGLSLIYGLMGVLNFAHGAFISVGSYGTWWFSTNVFDGIHSILLRWLLSSLVGLALGAAFAALVELVLIRPLYTRHIEQVLVTVGLSIAFVALLEGIWGTDPKTFVVPAWLHATTTVAGAHIPNDRWVEIATAAVVLVALQLFLRKTRYGLIIRAGVENRAMVQALGIDVRKAFTLVFAIGGHRRRDRRRAQRRVLQRRRARPGDEPARSSHSSSSSSAVSARSAAPPLPPCSWRSTQQYTNYYASAGVGDMVVVLLLGVVLLARPRGLAGAIVGSRA